MFFSAEKNFFCFVFEEEEQASISQASGHTLSQSLESALRKLGHHQ
jgi:hypothetical protein